MADYSRFESLLVEREDTVLVVTFNRPQARNAITINNGMHKEIEDLFSEVATDRGVNAVVITGAGKAFCAGGDVKGMANRAGDESSRLLKAPSTTGSARRLIVNMLEVEQPIIAAVNGDAIGLGATIALFCDVVIAAENARIADTHVKVGLVAGDGGAVIWPLLVGVNRAKEYLMTGDMLSAREAERIGLVNRVLPDVEVLPAAKELAQRLASGPTLAIRWSKASINKVLREQVNLVLDTSLAVESLSMLTDDHAEAARAFGEKRPAVFRGR
ncbi:MAG: enoyl-CoA hydratase/isomerase family protein [Chloroflexi bacterium]|nr:enoyl-CoA hydratase/isomerase family protein [Chloroflexota bacterium]